MYAKSFVLLLCFTLIKVSVVFGQKSYFEGFKTGYVDGYCHGEYGCTVLPPAPPYPLPGESLENYQDGYKRGFKLGVEDKQRQKSTKETTIPQYESPTWTTTQTEYVSQPGRLTTKKKQRWSTIGAIAMVVSVIGFLMWVEGKN